MDRFPRLVQRIERRARRLQGMRFAGIGLLVGGTCALLVAWLYHLGILILDRPPVGSLLGSPILCSLVLYLFGRRRDLSLAQTLLRIDLALGTGERLSSLYELHLRGGRSAFRDRLEASLRSHPIAWKRGLPVGLSRLGLMMGGSLALLGASLIIVLAPPSFSVPVMEGSTDSVVAPPESRRTSSPEQPPATLHEADRASASQGEEGGHPDQGLEDVLSNLWSSPDAEGLSHVGNAVPDELLEEQRELAQALSELLFRIEERLAEEKGSGLTEEERRALADLAEQLGGGSPLGRTLRELATEEDTGDLSRRLEKIRGLAESLRGPQETPTRETVTGEPLPSEDDERTLAWSPPEPGDEEIPPDEITGRAQRTAPSTGGGDDEQSDHLAQGDEELFGGEEGAPGGEVPTERTPGFLPFDLAGTVGESGEFRDFVTKGVPLEPTPTEEAEESGFSVDYEALRALLEGRAIPAEAQDVVRTYFETITQGGP